MPTCPPCSVLSWDNGGSLANRHGRGGPGYGAFRWTWSNPAENLTHSAVHKALAARNRRLHFPRAVRRSLCWKTRWLASGVVQKRQHRVLEGLGHRGCFGTRVKSYGTGNAVVGKCESARPFCDQNGYGRVRADVGRRHCHLAHGDGVPRDDPQQSVATIGVANGHGRTVIEAEELDQTAGTGELSHRGVERFAVGRIAPIHQDSGEIVDSTETGLEGGHNVVERAVTRQVDASNGDRYLGCLS